VGPVLCAMPILCVVVFAVGTVGGGYAQNLLDMDNLTSVPAVGEFLPRFKKMMIARQDAVATSEAVAFLAKYPDNKDVQIAGTYCWAFATMVDKSEAPLPVRKPVAEAAAEGLKRCLALIEKSPREEQSQKYANLRDHLIPMQLMGAACLAGSHTLVVRQVEDFFSKHPDSQWCNGAASALGESFRQMRDEDGLTSCLESLARRYKGRWGASPALWQLARIYDRKGNEEAFLSVLKRMESDFPDSNTYKQALRRFVAERKIQKYDALKKTNAPKLKPVSTSSTALTRNPDLATSNTCSFLKCGCGCQATTTTTATSCCKP